LARAKDEAFAAGAEQAPSSPVKGLADLKET
jgi:hypothetical protein